MKTHIPFLLLLVAVAGFISSCGEHSSAANTLKSDIIPVMTLPLQQGGAGVISVSGQFTTDDEVMLSFKTGGVIRKVYVKEGDAVRQGQVLAVLDLTEIGAQTRQAQLAYEKARRDHSRVQHLFSDSVATLEQLQNAETALQLAKQQLNAVQFNRSYSEIRAPRDGFVLRKLANEGQVVSTGTPVLQTNGAGSASWMLRVGLSDKEWASIAVNDKAAVETESLPGQQLEAVVQRKSEGIDPASGSFMADIRLTGPKPRAIASGMFGRAAIFQTAPAATMGGGNYAIPHEALLDGNGSAGFVFLTRDGRTARKVKVAVAGMQSDKVLITGAIDPGSKLIVSGSAYLSDNSRIRIVQ